MREWVTSLCWCGNETDQESHPNPYQKNKTKILILTLTCRSLRGKKRRLRREPPLTLTMVTLKR